MQVLLYVVIVTIVILLTYQVIIELNLIIILNNSNCYVKNNNNIIVEIIKPTVKIVNAIETVPRFITYFYHAYWLGLRIFSNYIKLNLVTQTHNLTMQ